MRPELLKPLRDVISDGLNVRRRSAAAISSVERTGSAAQKQALTDFFSDCGVKAGGTPPVLLPATVATVADAGTQLVSSSAGVSYAVSGTYTVAASVITSFKLPATSAVITNAAATVTVKNSAGSNISTAGVATVAAGVLTAVALPADRAGVISGTKVLGPAPTGTWTNGYTFTVANGVITGIVLS